MAGIRELEGAVKRLAHCAGLFEMQVTIKIGTGILVDLL